MDVKQWLKNKIADDHVEAFHHKSTLNYINDLENDLCSRRSDLRDLRHELESITRLLADVREEAKESNRRSDEVEDKIRHVLNQNRYVPVKLSDQEEKG